MSEFKEKQARAAVHIAATVMRAAGLCKMAEPFCCKRTDGQSDEHFEKCIDCIEQWLYRKARDRVRSTLEKGAYPWIRAADRLPPNNDEVLVIGSGDVMGLHFENATTLASYDRYAKAWALSDWPSVGIRVTYWMPIPAAPRGDEE